MPPIVAPATGTAAAVTAEAWPSATLLPVKPAVMLAPWPSTVALALPLSVAALPSTVEAAPVAEAPKPPALAFAPLDTGWTAVTLSSDTKGPTLPVVRLVTLVLVAKSCEPLTASVEVPESVPGATFVRFCAAPGAAADPPGAISASWFVVAVRCTGPTAPLLMLVMAVEFAVVCVLVAKSWLPLTASVEVAVSWPAATFWICRSAPAVPTLTAPAGVAPAKV